MPPLQKFVNKVKLRPPASATFIVGPKIAIHDHPRLTRGAILTAGPDTTLREFHRFVTQVLKLPQRYIKTLKEQRPFVIVSRCKRAEALRKGAIES
jgi:hypothetical protein